MSDESPHDALLRAHLSGIRYGIAALVFATLALVAAVVPDTPGLSGGFAVASLLTLTYSLLVVRRKNVVLETE